MARATRFPCAATVAGAAFVAFGFAPIAHDGVIAPIAIAVFGRMLRVVQLL